MLGSRPFVIAIAIFCTASFVVVADDSAFEQCGAHCERPVRIPIVVDECPVVAVTVYQDRAEVTRRVSTSVPATGTYEIFVSGIAAAMDPSTLRVRGVANALVLEVWREEDFCSGE